MIAAVDVHYQADLATAAAIGFERWSDEAPIWEHVVVVPGIAPYEPGAFYKRELPPVLKVLEGRDFDTVVIDGYVWLAPARKGLGAHLHEAIGKPVIGVAKTAFAGAQSLQVTRPGSTRPLYVTATGDAMSAARDIAAMHGAHRIPTLLRRVDQLCRGLAQHHTF